MRTFLNFILVFGTLTTTCHLFAAGNEGASRNTTPIQLGVYPPVQFPSEKFSVKGIRLSLLAGNNRIVKGLDFGLIGNSTEQEFSGLAVSGLYNYNRAKADIWGLQLAGLANVNKEGGKVVGLQLAAVNVNKFTNIYGVQLGLYNHASSVYGLQIGLINRAKNLHGLQIGLANFNEGGPFSVSPIINFGF